MKANFSIHTTCTVLTIFRMQCLYDFSFLGITWWLCRPSRYTLVLVIHLAGNIK